MKRTLFDKISSELMSEYPQLLGLTTGDVMNKFQYLRGQYQKILRKIKNTPSGSGAQTPQKWEFFSSCSFLQSVYDNCPTESSFIHPDDLNTQSQEVLVYEGGIEDLADDCEITISPITTSSESTPSSLPSGSTPSPEPDITGDIMITPIPSTSYAGNPPVKKREKEEHEQ
ncbi:hypothetical protein C7M84_012106 [Penaeus vannamei]|uniref:MADF domain-containing protein n=1 Tax=Penaeus vannamei TaxID=6689 RepID=A0A423SZN1_PENVA|nr:hypothetical protein C7M84_012106 [Penaeus vannamei]